MDKEIRIKMVKAMEFLVRNCNDLDLIEPWLMNAVADGDIKYGDFEIDPNDEEMEWYIEDDTFAEIMGLFLRIMSRARKDGGIYCDGILSE